ncbi:hypothetical protein CC80DRAFT_550350 [Byssothecium circinans]|uniref:Uncharacterized protein n=1 Tax=Byssothecium circinans TaxID=147558 RepID=A0A6A5TQ13_9PLEO|nr:hypothetical protein CC80DRAFT_550350 [Byssothecium circinans]
MGLGADITPYFYQWSTTIFNIFAMIMQFLTHKRQGRDIDTTKSDIRALNGTMHHHDDRIRELGKENAELKKLVEDQASEIASLKADRETHQTKIARLEKDNSPPPASSPPPPPAPAAKKKTPGYAEPTASSTAKRREVL